MSLFLICLSVLTFSVPRDYKIIPAEQKVLIVYFSCTGNTKNVANYINSAIGGDLIEIIPTVPYTKEDIDYTNSDSRASKERDDPSILPEISNEINNINEYSTIMIGYPLWWGKAPNIIRTFLKKYDFTDKNIITFSTSSSSSDGSKSILTELAPNAKWNDSFQRFSSSVSETVVKNWVNTLNLDFDTGNSKEPDTGSGNTDNNEQASQAIEQTTEEKNDNDDDNKNNRILIVYFSCTGNTKKVANYINSAIGGDLIEIIPTVPYTKEDIDYTNSDSRASKERDDPTILPEISNEINNINEYSTIMIGYPLWWGKAPNIIRTFLKKYDFTDKNIITFSTSSSSSDGSKSILTELAPNAKWNDSFQRFSSSVSETVVKNWVNTLNLDFDTGSTKEPDTGSDNKDNKIIVAYFSATGNTKRVAQNIRGYLKYGRIAEITPRDPYTSSDLNYNDPNSRVSREHNDSSFRPAFNDISDVDKAETILLGYPLWWGQAPHVVYSFIEKYNLKGKTIIPFCTSASSKLGSSASNLEEKVKDANWFQGQRFQSGVSNKDVNEWMDSIIESNSENEIKFVNGGSKKNGLPKGAIAGIVVGCVVVVAVIVAVVIIVVKKKHKVNSKDEEVSDP